jgi:hypothetical protein
VSRSAAPQVPTDDFSVPRRLSAVLLSVTLAASAVLAVAQVALRVVLSPASSVTISSPVDFAASITGPLEPLAVLSAPYGAAPLGEELAELEAVVAAPADFLLGVYVPQSPQDRLRAVAEWERSAGPTNAVMFFVDFSRGIEAPQLARVISSGRTPVVSLEPWYAGSGVLQPQFTLASIVAGDHDELLRRNARTIARADGTVVIRFAHEMNGDWYPWSERSNGNRPGEYVAAWQYVHRLFVSEGASNVLWLWSPNVTTYLPYPLEDLWPGEGYVDLVGVVGYLRAGETLESRYQDTFDELATFTDVPVIITETSVQAGADRNETVRRFVCDVYASDRVAGFIWFEAQARADWRLGEAAEAFRAARAGDCAS